MFYKYLIMTNPIAMNRKKIVSHLKLYPEEHS